MKARIIRRLGHEHITAVHEPDAGLTAYIAIHSTALGPSLGGVRYHSRQTPISATVPRSTGPFGKRR